MQTAAKIATGLSAVVIAGLVAFAVAPAIAPPAERPALAAAQTSPEKPAAASADKPAEGAAPDECRSGTQITFSKVSADAPMTGGLSGKLTDRGPTEAASGELSEDGFVVSYTVEPGDALAGIGDRFCVDYVTVAKYNHVYSFNDINPGDVLILSPDPSVEWVDPSKP